MTLDRWTRRLPALTLGLVLAAVALTAPARAQEPAPEGGTSENAGRSLDGYLATGCLAGLVVFAVCKSARR